MFRIGYLSAVAVASIALFFNCTKDQGVIPAPATPAPPPVPGACDSITYTKHMQPLAATSCTSCHHPTLLNGGYDFTNYNGLKAASDAGKLYNVIFVATGSKKMPQGSDLTAEQKEIIRCWIENGEQK